MRDRYDQDNNNTRCSRSGLGDLLIVLERLEGLHRDLCQTLTEKLKHIRRSDQSGIFACTDREQAIVSRVAQQEGLRKQLMERIGRGYGMGREAARALSARKLAERVEEPVRSDLTHRADKLQDTLTDVERINGIVKRVSIEILTHLREAFAAITPIDEPGGEYTERGRSFGGQPGEHCRIRRRRSGSNQIRE